MTRIWQTGFTESPDTAMNFAKIKSFGLYTAGFLIGRGLLFVAPILLANFITTEQYGQIEVALALSSHLALFLTMGTGSVVPLVLVNNVTETQMSDIIVYHAVWVLLCLVVAAFIWAFALPFAVGLAVTMGAARIVQGLASVHLKTISRPNASIFVDAGLFSVMALCAGGAFLTRWGHSMFWIIIGLVVYTSVITAFYIPQIYREGRWTPTSLTSAIPLGFPLMLASILSTAVATSASLALGYLSDFTTVGDYGVLYRVAAAAVIMHQLLLIVSFRNVFEMPPEKVQFLAARITGLVGLTALAMCVMLPFVSFLFGPAFDGTYKAHSNTMIWLTVQSVLWSGIALNDLLATRFRIMPAVLKWSATFAVLVTGAILLFVKSDVALLPFVQAHALVMLGFFIVQSAVLACQGVNNKIFVFVTLGSYIAAIALLRLLGYW